MEIKFRFWQTYEKYMLNWDEINTSSLYELLTEKDSIPMQFTGLTDKNGKEIYEGDFLIEWDEVNAMRIQENEPDFICHYVVRYFEGEWICDTLESGTTYKNEDSLKTILKLCNVEINGNIYENPELLCN